MTAIKLIYNPFMAQSAVEYKGKPLELRCIGNGENTRLQEYMYSFFPDLEEELNLGPGSECSVQFEGTPGDFDDLVLAWREYQEKYSSIFQQPSHCNSGSPDFDTRLDDLRRHFKAMQQESPFVELREPKLKELFDKAVNKEFEISVIATMSSGKSTLVNAILGKNLLPARNEATTAKKTRVIDIDGSEKWEVRGLFEDGSAAPWEEATIEKVDAYNADPLIPQIELRGDILAINSQKMNLVLSDTPGPNSSVEEHNRHFEELIKDDTYKPLIMYVFNAQNLKVEADKKLLEKAAKAMEKSGKQSKDRFIFVLNKVDELDPEKEESVEKTLPDLKKYLSHFGIEGAAVFPVSAELGRLIRMRRSGQGLTEEELKKTGFFLTRKQDNFLNTQSKYFIEEHKLHLSRWAELSVTCKKSLDERLRAAIEKGDEMEQALIYSGIPALELAINEYLEKYALAVKIKQAIDVFKQIVQAKKIENEHQRKLQASREAREDLRKQLESINENLLNGDFAKRFIGEINTALEKDSDVIRDKIKWLYEDITAYQEDEDAIYEQSIHDSTVLEKALDTMNWGILQTAHGVKTLLTQVLPDPKKEKTSPRQNRVLKILEKGRSGLEDFVTEKKDKIIAANDMAKTGMIKESVAEIMKIETKDRLKDYHERVDEKIQKIHQDALSDQLRRYAEEYTQRVRGLVPYEEIEAWMRDILRQAADAGNTKNILDDISAKAGKIKDTFLSNLNVFGRKFVSLEELSKEREGLFDELRKFVEEGEKQIFSDIEEFRELFNKTVLPKLEDKIRDLKENLEHTTRNDEAAAESIKRLESEGEWLRNFMKKLEEIVKI